MPISGKKILFAWELGEGLGHLPPIKAIAKALKPQGVQFVYALRETANAIPVLQPFGGELLTAPHWAKPRVPEEKSLSFADILAANGYGQPDHASAILQAWDKVIDQIKPDLVVCDHAPSAMLSAFRRIPVAFVGNGFAVPPADTDYFPPYIAGRGDIAFQRKVHENISAACTIAGRASPDTLTAPFRGAFRGIYSFPVIDAYRAVRIEKVLGPIEPQPPCTPTPHTRRLFVYSAANIARIDALMQCLLLIGPEASVFLRGADTVQVAILKSRGVEVFDKPPALESVLPRASAVFSHAGSGLTNAVLASGRPHIVFPRHFEAKASALGLEEAGCGIRLDQLEPGTFRSAFERAHSDEALKQASQIAGQSAQNFVRETRSLETTIAAITALMNG